MIAHTPPPKRPKEKIKKFNNGAGAARTTLLQPNQSHPQHPLGEILPHPTTTIIITLNSACTWYNCLSNREMHITNGNIPRRRGQLCLKLGHYNIRGGLKHKGAELDYIFDKYAIDVLGISESNQLAEDHIATNDKNYNFVPAFNYNPSKTRLGVFIKKGLNFKVNKNKMDRVDLPCVWLEMTTQGQKIAVVNVYREFRLWLPKADRERSKASASISEQFNRWENFVELWKESVPEYDELWVLGDMNFDPAHVLQSNQISLKPFVNIVEDRIIVNGFRQLVSVPTWTKSDGSVRRCLDHIYTNSPHYRSVNAVSCGSSDHCLVTVVKVCPGKFSRSQFTKLRDFKNFNQEDFTYILSTMNLNDLLSVDDPNTQIQCLTAALNVAADLTCPLVVSHVRAFHTRWMNEDIKNRILERDIWYKKYIKAKNNGNDAAAEVAHQHFRKLRNYLNHNIREAKKQYYKKQINNINRYDSQNCWRRLDELSGRNSAFREPITIIKDGIILDKPELVAREFSDFFHTKVQKIKNSLPEPEEPELPEWSEHRKLIFSRVSTENIIKHIKSLSNSKAFGHDTISNDLLKRSKHLIAPVLASICSNVIETGVFPEFWKHGIVNALHKKGSKTDVSNYRPITLLCSLSKVLEKVIFEQIVGHLEHFNLFDPRQYGFRKDHSTTLAVLDYVNIVLRAKECAETSKVNTILLDLSAAFDIVSHDILLKKMVSLGFGENAINLLRSYLKNRTFSTQVELAVSKSKHVEHGVPQGSVLGPLLYLIFVSDVGGAVDDTCIVYADDTNCVVAAPTNEELSQKSNATMSNLIKYFAKAGLKLNKSKTEIINHNSRNVPVQILVDPNNNVTQDSVRDARMLGIQVDTDLTFQRHIENLIQDVTSRLKIFKKISSTADQRARLMFGYGILLSKFHYGICAYSGAGSVLLEKVRVVYDRCVRAIYGRGAWEKSVEDIRKELQILSFQQLIDFYDITTISKIIRTRKPVHLSNLLGWEGDRRDTRQTSRGRVRLEFIPTSEKARRSFLPRSVRAYNVMPRLIKELPVYNFNKNVKRYLLGIPIEGDPQTVMAAVTGQ